MRAFLTPLFIHKFQFYLHFACGVGIKGQQRPFQQIFICKTRLKSIAKSHNITFISILRLRHLLLDMRILELGKSYAYLDIMEL